MSRSYTDRYAERVAEVEHWVAEKKNRAAQLTAEAAVRVAKMPPTIGGRAVTVEDVAYAAIVADPLRKDMESSRSKAVAEATMFGLGALLEVLSRLTQVHPTSTNTKEE